MDYYHLKDGSPQNISHLLSPYWKELSYMGCLTGKEGREMSFFVHSSAHLKILLSERGKTERQWVLATHKFCVGMCAVKSFNLSLLWASLCLIFKLITLPWLISEGHGFQSATNLSTAKSHAVYISLFFPERWHASFLPNILLKSRYGMIVAFSLSPPPTLSVQEMRFSSAWLHWSKPSFFFKAPFFLRTHQPPV